MSSANAQFRAAGRQARKDVPRQAHAEWQPPSDRPHPLALLRRDDDARLVDLLPVRYQRMLVSPFTFFRGAASIMARDLQSTPVSGIYTQICGDCHLLNFGAYASPERRYVFDLNDFDETTLGPWEFDIKRLATSVHVAARSLGFRARDTEHAVLACMRSYRERMGEFASMRVLDIWYARLDEAELVRAVSSAQARRRGGARDAVDSPTQTGAHLYPKFVRCKDGSARIVDHKQSLFHPGHVEAFLASLRTTFVAYRGSFSTERQALFDRFAFVDAAYKVVGIGSVGTRCSVALFLAQSDDPLFLQIKEARVSVFERFARAGGERSVPFRRAHGKRVVTGQRLMQAASDLFLGWGRGDDGRSYYVRQLRDMKTSADVTHMSPHALARYASLCGWALARAHAKASGEAARIAGYLGRGDAFDLALASFARAYALQNERDYAAIAAAVKSGEFVPGSPPR